RCRRCPGPLCVPRRATLRPRGARRDVRRPAQTPPGARCAMMHRFAPGNTVELLRNGTDFFPALIAASDGASSEVWLETYIFADDPAGRAVADAMVRAAGRGVEVRVLVDG